MVDDQQAKPTLEKETQASTMPIDEQKTAPEAKVDQPPKESLEDKDTTTVTEGVPESASERTKREFEKLRQKLREEREARQQIEQAYRTVMPKKQPVTEKPMELSPLVDPQTGLLNEEALAQRDKLLLEAQERAKSAEKTAKQAIEDSQQRLLQSEEKEMFAEFPHLDPQSDKFDKKLHRLTRSIKLDSMLNPDDYEGKQLSGVEAARLAKEQLKDLKSVKAEGAQEAIDQLTPKEQAALEATGTPARRQQTISLDDLRRRSRKGDWQAIMERLKSSQS